jgi:hypothetical protein
MGSKGMSRRDRKERMLYRPNEHGNTGNLWLRVVGYLDYPVNCRKK